ncbi:MAG: dihydroneopterin aldolase [Candidatus Planktophila sp.]|jgi:7,8-dihydroneopterin aldolase/epimerase/oxygenase|tara:strand:+ start:5393 stop:5749 length:357 start_codon:yes stop_codon:yes gene_type:complete
MSDRINLKGIKGFGYHGVFEDEAKNGQDFFVDLEISLDLSRASSTDDLKDTIDYGSLASLVVDEISGDRVQLIERLAGRIADRIKSGHPQIIKISVTVHKPMAPVSAQVSDISVTITR